MPEHSTIQAVIFDLGGVILRTEDPQPRLELAGALGFSRAALEEAVFQNPAALAAERGEGRPDAIWEEAARILGLAPDMAARLRRDFFAGDRVDQVLMDAIRAMRAGGRRTGILSNSWYADLPALLREPFGIADAFDFVVSSAAVGVRKPAEGAFLAALQAAGAPAQASVFVDDFAANVTAARALGMYAVHFTGREAALAELERLLSA